MKIKFFFFSSQKFKFYDRFFHANQEKINGKNYSIAFLEKTKKKGLKLETGEVSGLLEFAH